MLQCITPAEMTCPASVLKVTYFLEYGSAEKLLYKTGIRLPRDIVMTDLYHISQATDNFFPSTSTFILTDSPDFFFVNTEKILSIFHEYSGRSAKLSVLTTPPPQISQTSPCWKSTATA